jgi:murein DD-endopeptidase MepM/ murein hydrolase activator NlpD
MRKLLVAVIALVLVAAVVFFAAGRQPGPAIEIANPVKTIGASSPLDVSISAAGAAVSDVRVSITQKGVVSPVLSTEMAGSERHITRGNDGVVRITHVVGKEGVPGLTSGPAELTVSAKRSVLFGLRSVETVVTKPLTVRLERPTVSVVSLHHYINQGGSEMVVYRVSPADVASGVRVGDNEYPGFPAAGLTADAVSIADPALRVAFFALEYDQGAGTPISLYARDDAGNSATAQFDYRIFPKPARASRIPIPDAFLQRVVPAILATTDEVKPSGSLLEQFLVINGELRRKNAERIAAFASKTSAELLWRGVVFHPFTNTAVESAFADRRTYTYDNKEVDHQVHLGFDLASFANASIVAANRGRVLHAGPLGIYGNAVILDHGLGVQSLYAHLSSIGVQVDAVVDKDQEIGKSGITGLAGGDHLHFTMLVNGRMVNPVEWWDQHWIDDRILRKLRDVH